MTALVQFEGLSVEITSEPLSSTYRLVKPIPFHILNLCANHVKTRPKFNSDLRYFLVFTLLPHEDVKLIRFNTSLPGRYTRLAGKMELAFTIQGLPTKGDALYLKRVAKDLVSKVQVYATNYLLHS